MTRSTQRTRRIGIVVSVAAMAVAATAPFVVASRDASAAVPALDAPTGGASGIGFVSGRGLPPGQARIFRMTTAGDDEQPLSPDRYGVRPDWAPDGHRVVYAKAVAAGRPPIEVFDADGRCTHASITTPEYLPAQPVFSPDGTQLAYVVIGPSRNDLWVSDVRGGRQRVVLAGGVIGDAAWSPDGRTLAYTAVVPGAYPAIGVVAVAGGAPRLLTDGTVPAEAPEWSPDGRRIVFSQGFDQSIVSTHPLGGDRRVLVAAADGEVLHHPELSPDGTLLAFDASDRSIDQAAGLPDGIYVAAADGTGPRRLTDDGSDPTWIPAVPARDSGYRMVAPDGGVFSFGGACFHGSMGGRALRRPVVGIATPGGGNGYWLAADDGGVFAFGDAPFRGSAGGLPLNQPIVGIAATPKTGFWLVARDGGIFSYGDAEFYGSTGAIRLNEPIVGMTSTPTGGGYWLVAADGGVFAFGDARFVGSTGAIRLNQPIVAMAATPSAGGYWLVAADGGVFAFGDARFHGSTGGIRLNQPIVDVVATSTGNGYRLVAADGGVFTFGDARYFGSTGDIRLAAPIVGAATD